MKAADYHRITTAQQWQTTRKAIAEMGLTPAWSGLNLWIEDANSTQAACLQMLGALWSAKRGAWYIRAAEDVNGKLIEQGLVTA